MIRILVTDDHTVLRTGLAGLLEREEDMTAVGQTATADQAVIKARDLQPDVILLDVVMPRKSGFDALPELRKVAPEARVIMLSMQTSPSSIRQALISGVQATSPSTPPRPICSTPSAGLPQARATWIPSSAATSSSPTRLRSPSRSRNGSATSLSC